MFKLEHMGLAATVRLIKKLPDGELRLHALTHLLDELLEEEIEWRTGLRHQNVGWHKVSSIGGAGEGRGTCTGLVDQVSLAVERYCEESQWRQLAKTFLSHLSERQIMAVLLAAYPVSSIKNGSSQRVITLEQVAKLQNHILQILGWSPNSLTGDRFCSKFAIRDTSRRAKRKLIFIISDFL